MLITSIENLVLDLASSKQYGRDKSFITEMNTISIQTDYINSSFSIWEVKERVLNESK